LWCIHRQSYQWSRQFQLILVYLFWMAFAMHTRHVLVRFWQIYYITIVAWANQALSTAHCAAQASTPFKGLIVQILLLRVLCRHMPAGASMSSSVALGAWIMHMRWND
jgi:hypothetical protein